MTLLRSAPWRPGRVWALALMALTSLLDPVEPRGWATALGGQESGAAEAPNVLGTPNAPAQPSLSPFAPPPYEITEADEQLLDEIERAGVRYFWENGHPKTGLVKDRSRAEGPDERRVASIAATGFGLGALVIAAERGYLPLDDVLERVRRTLEFLRSGLQGTRGFFYHFVDWETGERAWKCEVSSIDTTILLCGVIACGAYFEDARIRELSGELVDGADWRWMLADGETLSHGWKPESGFLRSRWDRYCELIMIYLLGLGSETHPLPPSSWEAWKRPWVEEEGLRYVGADAPLFVHQYSHAWIDLRGRRDAHTDYFRNSVLATEAHRRFCIGLAKEYPHYGEDLWGITASDSRKGYVVWGGPPTQGPIDGTVVPCASAGSLPFLPAECLRVLRTIRRRHGPEAWGRYGFADAFDPASGWVNPDVIGIDVGISVLMADNLRSGLLWRVMARSPVVERGLDRARLGREEKPPADRGKVR